MPIVDTQKLIEDELKTEQKKSFDYNAKKGRFGKFDPSKGTEKEQWDKNKGPKTQDELDEEAKQKQRQANASRERQAVADADLAAFQAGEGKGYKDRRNKLIRG